MINKIKFPNYLNPYENKNIIRLGNDYDGGYLVDKESVLETEILISIGISYDWTFEKDFFKLNNCKISTYDGTVGKNFFYAKIKNRMKNILNKKSGAYLIKTIWWIILPFRFFIFFNNFRLVNRKKHYEMFVYENNKKLDIDYFVHKNGYSPKFIRFCFKSVFYCIRKLQRKEKNKKIKKDCFREEGERRTLAYNIDVIWDDDFSDNPIPSKVKLI